MSILSSTLKRLSTLLLLLKPISSPSSEEREQLLSTPIILSLHLYESCAVFPSSSPPAGSIALILCLGVDPPPLLSVLTKRLWLVGPCSTELRLIIPRPPRLLPGRVQGGLWASDRTVCGLGWRAHRLPPGWRMKGPAAWPAPQTPGTSAPSKPAPGSAPMQRATVHSQPQVGRKREAVRRVWRDCPPPPLAQHSRCTVHFVLWRDMKTCLFTCKCDPDGEFIIAPEPAWKLEE